MAQHVITSALHPLAGAVLTFNYNVLFSGGDQFNEYANMWHELNIFGEQVNVVSSGIYQSADIAGLSSGYTRFESYLQWESEQGLWQVMVGDVINAAPAWGSSVRIGGIRFNRDFSIDPGLITYPVPAFYGETAVPSQVDLLLNGMSYQRQFVGAGPFLLQTVPFAHGAGQAELVTTDAQGRQTNRVVDFYISSQLLASHKLDYDVSVGHLREGFGLVSDAYSDEVVGSASLRYGLGNYFTPNFHGQSGLGVTMAGAGGNLLLWRWGVLEFAQSSSRYQHTDGKQALLGYSYANGVLGISGRYTKRQKNYKDLATLYQQEEETRQWQGSISLYSDTLGTFSINHFSLERDQLATSRFASVNWSRSFAAGISALVSLGEQQYQQREKTIMLSLNFPLWGDGQASVSGRRDGDKRWINQLQASRSTPYEGGMGWNVAVDDSSHHNAFAAVNYRAHSYETSASVYRQFGKSQYSADIDGALVLMDGGLYWGRRVREAFAVVVSDEPYLPVRYSNRLVGKTNRNGKMLVNDLHAYQRNTIGVELDNLPLNAHLADAEKNAVPRRRSGVVLDFSIDYTRPVLFIVQDIYGKPLPMGERLVDLASGEFYLVGWDGEVYVEHMRAPLHLRSETAQCELALALPDARAEEFPRLGPFTCHKHVAR